MYFRVFSRLKQKLRNLADSFRDKSANIVVDTSRAINIRNGERLVGPSRDPVATVPESTGPIVSPLQRNSN